MILVFVEHDQGQADRSSLEALSAARRVASAAGAAEPVAAVLIGPGAAVGAASLAGYGVAEAHVVEDERLSAYAPAGWGRTLAQLAASLAPTIVLAAGTDRGHEVLAYAAAMSEAPMAANCLEIRPGSPFEVTRQRWGGSLLEEAALDGSPGAGGARFLTVAEHAFQPEPASESSPVAAHPFVPTLSETD
ncbi:MAG: electron transfer flavoprotein subunit alpha/FixB family protein, partial [Candidatus Limnocylindrales bacterium]